MAPYSMDLRERVVAAGDEGGDTRAEIAERPSVCESWIRRLLQRRRQTGAIAPKPHGGGRPPAFDGEAAKRRRAAVAADPDATPKESAAASGIACSTAAVDRALRRLGITRTKKSVRAAEQDRPERKAEHAAWRDEFAAIGPSRLVLPGRERGDPTTARARRYGRAPRGERGDGPVPHGHWEVVTPTAALRLGGGACLAFDGATDAACFETYVGECLVPTLREGDIVIMDDLACPKTAEVDRLIRSAGAEWRHLPAYRPDLSPIEEMFSKIEEFLRSAAARTGDALIGAMGDAPRSVTPGDILGWFRHRGCRYKQE